MIEKRTKEVQNTKPWNTPKLVSYGAAVKITKVPPIKNKLFGPADDVLVANEPILHNRS